MLEVLVGQIASGKSTYCRQRANEGSLIVNDDSIVSAVHTQDIYYDLACKPLYKQLEVAIISYGIAVGRNVVIDRPNEHRHTRKRYVSLAKSMGVPSKVILFEWKTPEEHAQRRFLHDSRGLSLETWIKIAVEKATGFEPLDWQEEGFSQLLYAKFTNNQIEII